MLLKIITRIIMSLILTGVIASMRSDTKVEKFKKQFASKLKSDKIDLPKTFSVESGEFANRYETY